MLMRRDISKQRGLAGRLLVGTAALAVLATTATLVPAGVEAARAQTADIPAPPTPPPAADAPPPPTAPDARDAPGVMVFTDHSEQVKTDADGKKREVHRIVIRRDGQGDGKASTVMFTPADGKDKARHIDVRLPGSLSRDDVLATLKEQGVSGKRAEAIADKLEAKRKERMRTVLAPMPPMPPIPPMPHGAWKMPDGKAMVIGKCGDGSRAAPIVNREEGDANRHSRVVMMACNDGPEGRALRLSALKKAREAFVEGERARGMSDDIRAKVAADLDKAIAEMEKSAE